MSLRVQRSNPSIHRQVMLDCFAIARNDRLALRRNDRLALRLQLSRVITRHDKRKAQTVFHLRSQLRGKIAALRSQ